MGFKKIVQGLMKGLVAMMVVGFLGIHSFNFFLFIFDADHWFYAFLGFGLTSVSAIAYMILLLTSKDKETGQSALTDLEATIVIIMMFISIVGEFATAGFGMQVEAMKKSGIVMTQSDMDFMVLIVTGLGLIHGIALIVFYTGDMIKDIMKRDADGDGIPDVFDFKDNRKIAQAKDVDQVKLKNSQSQ